jgi:hypothetical protein
VTKDFFEELPDDIVKDTPESGRPNRLSRNAEKKKKKNGADEMDWRQLDTHEWFRSTTGRIIKQCCEIIVIQQSLDFFLSNPSLDGLEGQCLRDQMLKYTLKIQTILSQLHLDIIEKIRRY